jgi:hypothetical protein
MRKPIFIVLILIALLTGGFYILNGYIYNQKQGENIEPVTQYRGKLSGEYVCLPHIDQDGPQTLECAFGIKTDSNEYYSLDLNLLSQELPGIQVGDRFTANGLITPVESLSSDGWKKYPIEGIFTVTDSIELLTTP